MAILHGDYDRICSRLRDQPLNSQLKAYFQDIINSKRRSSKMSTVGQLIDVLQKRDVLSPAQPEHIHYILSFYNGLPRDAAFQPHVRNINSNIASAYGGPVLYGPYNRVIPTPLRDPVKRVHRLIANQIGTKWKDLARELDIPEGWIDNLKVAYSHNLRDCVHEVLQYHYNLNYPQNNWRNKLQEALRNARRCDLSTSVGEILGQAGIS